MKLQKSRPKFVRKDLIQVSIGHASTLPPFENRKDYHLSLSQLYCSRYQVNIVYFQRKLVVFVNARRPKRSWFAPKRVVILFIMRVVSKEVGFMIISSI